MERAEPFSRREFLAAGMAAAACSAVTSLDALAAGDDLVSVSLSKAAALVRSRSVSPVELTEASLKRIDALNPKINAYITVTRELAMQQARELEADQKRGRWRGALHGVPIALKDNIDTAGVRTTGASELFKDRVPAEDAEVARRLKAAGAILLGKLNLHEFAYGGTSAVTYFAPVHNPWNLEHHPGGSSGGPAAALAAEMCFGSIGTDTAGSVRIPASYCSIVGLKPTYGRVSNRGVVPLSWSLDHTGPMTKTVEDAAILLNVIAGYDELDPTTIDVPAGDYTRALKMPTARLRVGVPRRPFFDNLDPEVAKAVDDALEAVRKLTASVADVEFPAAGNPAQVWGPEIYAYHAKWIAESPEKYQPATRAQILRDGEIKAVTYAQAHRAMEIARREIDAAFKTVDVLVMPTMKGTAPLIGSGAGGINTSQFDWFGLPAISVPCGFSRAGLPIGLQIVAAHWNEATVLALAHAYEQATEWHKRKPQL
jgi:aspartyl-tRNA(Asn)/glutamyl-tRNA(Gln) amidotransferase subunit A